MNSPHLRQQHPLTSVPSEAVPRHINRPIRTLLFLFLVHECVGSAEQTLQGYSFVRVADHHSDTERQSIRTVAFGVKLVDFVSQSLFYNLGALLIGIAHQNREFIAA